MALESGPLHQTVPKLTARAKTLKASLYEEFLAQPSELPLAEYQRITGFQIYQVRLKWCVRCQSEPALLQPIHGTVFEQQSFDLIDDDFSR